MSTCPPSTRCVEAEGTLHQFPLDATDAEISKALATAHPQNNGMPGVGPEGNFAIGVGKGALAVGRAFDPTRVVSPLLRILQKQFPNSPELEKLASSGESVDTAASDLIKPEGTAQQVGAFAAKAVPSTALAMGTSGASLPIQAALQGVLGAAQSEAKTPTGIAVDTGLAAMSPYAAKLVTATMKGIGGLAVKAYQAALSPTREAAKVTTEKIVPELMKQGVAGSLESLAEKGASKSEAIGQELQMSYKDAVANGITIDADQIAAALNAAKQPFLGTITGTNQKFATNEGAVTAIEALQKKLINFGPKASPEELWAFRKALDDVVQQSNGFTRPLNPSTAAGISKKARAIIQDSLGAAVPETVEKNAEYSLWQGLEEVANATLKRNVGKSSVLKDIIAPGSRAATGAALGYGADRERGIIPGAVAGVAAPYLLSPSVVTRAALGVNAATGPAAQEMARLLTILGVTQSPRPEEKIPVPTPTSLVPQAPDEAAFISRYQGAQ